MKTIHPPADALLAPADITGLLISVLVLALIAAFWLTEPARF